MTTIIIMITLIMIIHWNHFTVFFFLSGLVIGFCCELQLDFLISSFVVMCCMQRFGWDTVMWAKECFCSNLYYSSGHIIGMYTRFARAQHWTAWPVRLVLYSYCEKNNAIFESEQKSICWQLFQKHLRSFLWKCHWIWAWWFN